MDVQIFGLRKSSGTRKALRFFSERRIRTHFVDLRVRPASVGELRRFVEKLGVEAVVDRESTHFLDLGLTHAHFSDRRWLETLAEEPLLLRMPLVRWKNELTVGDGETRWREWVERR